MTSFVFVITRFRFRFEVHCLIVSTPTVSVSIIDMLKLLCIFMCYFRYTLLIIENVYYCCIIVSPWNSYIYVHLASSSVTPAGSVHKSRGDNVVRMWVKMKRLWCPVCVLEGA